MSETQETPAPTPAPEVESGLLTQSEADYFDSGGEKAPVAETAPVAPVADPVEEQKPKHVPLSALHEERERRKASDSRLREIEMENARYAERFRILEQMRQPEPAPVPKPEDDFIEHSKHLGNELEAVKQRLQQHDQQAKAQHQEQQFLSAYAQDAARVRAENPEFNDAYKFMIDGRTAEIAALGIEGAEAAQLLRNDELSIVRHAMSRNTSPAEAIFKLAKARGFTAPKPQVDQTQKLDAIQKGQAANKSLSSAGGEAGAESMTAERALAMSTSDFDIWCNKHPAQARRLMGG